MLTLATQRESLHLEELSHNKTHKSTEFLCRQNAPGGRNKLILAEKVWSLISDMYGVIRNQQSTMHAIKANCYCWVS